MGIKYNNKMEPKTKFKLKAFFYYLIVEPWTEKVQMPNLRTIIWISIFFSFFFKLKVLLFGSLFLGVIFHLISEFKSGRFIYWYRQRKFREQREALKRVRNLKKNGHGEDIEKVCSS